jgi:Cap4 SAVED domain
MINAWLNPVRRDTSELSFNVTDLQENLDSVPTHAQLASLLSNAYWDTNYLSDLAGRYGADAVRERFLQARAATQMRVRRGDFGEAVAVQYLKEVEQYHIPVVKLRFKMAANQTLPGTDCIAFKLDAARLVEVRYVESKVRTSLELSVAVAGTSQLRQDADAAMPEILTFVARCISETKNLVTELVEQYIFSRDTELDTFKLLVFHENDAWDERILQNLEDAEIGLEPLEVYVARTANLAVLSDAAFRVLGASGVIEDDD